MLKYLKSAGNQRNDSVHKQAFEGLRNAKRRVRRPDCTLVTTDHVSHSWMGVRKNQVS